MTRGCPALLLLWVLLAQPATRTVAAAASRHSASGSARPVLSARAAPCVRLDVYDELPSVVVDPTRGTALSTVEPPSWSYTNHQTDQLLKAIDARKLVVPSYAEPNTFYTHRTRLRTFFSPHEGASFPQGTPVVVRHFRAHSKLELLPWVREVQTLLAVQRAGCHPHIIRCLGFGVLDVPVEAFIVLEDVDEDLASFATKHSMLPHLDTFLSQMSSALVFLQDNAGRVHGLLRAHDIVLKKASSPRPHFLLAHFDYSLSVRHKFETIHDLVGVEEHTTLEDLQSLSPLRSLAIAADTENHFLFHPGMANTRSTKTAWSKLLRRVVEHANGPWSPHMHEYAFKDHVDKTDVPDSGVISVMNPLLDDVLQYLAGPSRLGKLDVFSLAIIAQHILAGIPFADNIMDALACGAHRWLVAQAPHDGVLMHEFHARDRLSALTFITHNVNLTIPAPKKQTSGWQHVGWSVGHQEERARLLAQQLVLCGYDMTPSHVHPFFRWIVNKPTDISTVFWNQGLGVRFVCKGDDITDLSTVTDAENARFIRSMMRIVPDDAPSMRDVCNHFKCTDYSIYLPQDRLVDTHHTPIRVKKERLPAGADKFLTSGDQHPAELRTRLHALIKSAPETRQLLNELNAVLPMDRTIVHAWVAHPLDVEDTDLMTVLQFEIEVVPLDSGGAHYLLYALELELTSPRDGRGPVSAAHLHLDQAYRRIKAGLGDRAKYALRDIVKDEWRVIAPAALRSSPAVAAMKKYQTWLHQLVKTQLAALYPGQHIELTVDHAEVKLKAEAAEEPPAQIDPELGV